MPPTVRPKDHLTLLFPYGFGRLGQQKSLTISSVRECFGSYLSALDLNSLNASCMRWVVWCAPALGAEVLKFSGVIISLDHLFVLLSSCQPIPVIGINSERLFPKICPRHQSKVTSVPSETLWRKLGKLFLPASTDSMILQGPTLTISMHNELKEVDIHTCLKTPRSFVPSRM